MNEFVIVFRESLEASLIVGIIYTIIKKKNLSHLLNKLWLGVVLSLFVSVGVAFFLINLKSLVGNNAYAALFEGVFLYLTAGFIYYVVFWLSKHVSDTNQIESDIDSALQVSSWGIFFVVFFAILREGFETVIFLMSSFSIQGSFSQCFMALFV